MRRLALVLLPVAVIACAPGGASRDAGVGETARGAPPEDERNAAFLALAAEAETRPEFVTRLATAARELHRQSEAIESLERALEARPNDPDLLFVTAALEMDLERRGSAEAHLRRALEIEKGHLPSVVQLCAYLAEGYRWQEALDLVTAAEEGLPGSAPGAEAAGQRAPRRPTGVLLAQKARILLALGRTSEAVATAREAAALAPDYGEASYGLGLALLAAGRVEEASAALTAARRIDPDHLEAAYQAMNVAELLGREEEAREARVRFEELYRRRLRTRAGEPGAEGRP